MGKKKKITEKVKTFYRGAAAQSCRKAGEDEINIIVQAFESCLLRKNCIFKIDWTDGTRLVRLVVGLSAGLRCLKQKKTLAVIYDETASPHLSKYLIEFAAKSGISILQAPNLIDIAPKLKLRTMLVVSLVTINVGSERPGTKDEVVKSDQLNKLCHLLSDSNKDYSRKSKICYKLPTVEKVISTGKSKAKKNARKTIKK